MLRTLLVLAAAACLPMIAAAQARPSQLVCFERASLETSLGRMTNPQQLLRADRVLRTGSCDFVAVPSGSTARYLGIHQTARGFLFPVYAVTYSTTGQLMVAVDGAFREGPWRVERLRGSGMDVLVPRDCGVLDGFVVAAGTAPRYVVVPTLCRPEVVR